MEKYVFSIVNSTNFVNFLGKVNFQYLKIEKIKSHPIYVLNTFYLLIGPFFIHVCLLGLYT
jgi:hypothetical protein